MIEWLSFLNNQLAESSQNHWPNLFFWRRFIENLQLQYAHWALFNNSNHSGYCERLSLLLFSNEFRPASSIGLEKQPAARCAICLTIQLNPFRRRANDRSTLFRPASPDHSCLTIAHHSSCTLAATPLPNSSAAGVPILRAIVVDLAHNSIVSSRYTSGCLFIFGAIPRRCCVYPVFN